MDVLKRAWTSLSVGGRVSVVLTGLLIVALLGSNTYVAIQNVLLNRSLDAVRVDRENLMEAQKETYRLRISNLESEVDAERQKNAERDILITDALLRISTRLNQLNEVDETVADLDTTELTDLLNRIAAERGFH